MSEDVAPYGAGEIASDPHTLELRALIKLLEMSQREAADAIGVETRSMRRWVAANPPPPLMAILALRYLLAKARGPLHWSQRSPNDPITPEDIAAANARGGEAAVDELLRTSVADESDRVALVQMPRGTI